MNRVYALVSHTIFSRVAGLSFSKSTRFAPLINMETIIILFGGVLDSILDLPLPRSPFGNPKPAERCTIDFSCKLYAICRTFDILQ